MTQDQLYYKGQTVHEMGFLEIVILRDLTQSTVFYEGFEKIKKAH